MLTELLDEQMPILYNTSHSCEYLEKIAGIVLTKLYIANNHCPLIRHGPWRYTLQGSIKLRYYVHPMYTSITALVELLRNIIWGMLTGKLQCTILHSA